jgi:methionine--tRNA ligase beta chain
MMAEAKPTIAFDDFAKVDLRVARVKAAEYHPNADKLLKLQLDDGTEEGRQICAGIRAYYEPDDLVGKSVVIVANLEPRKIRGEMSQGMMLAASTPADEDGAQRDVVFVTLAKDLPPGSTIS